MSTNVPWYTQAEGPTPVQHDFRSYASQFYDWLFVRACVVAAKPVYARRSCLGNRLKGVEDTEGFIALIEDLFPGKFKTVARISDTYSTKSNFGTAILVTENMYVYGYVGAGGMGSMYVNVIGSDEKEVAEFDRKIVELTELQPETGSVYSLFQTTSGFMFKKVGVAGEEIEFGNYEEQVGVEFKRIAEQLRAEKPSGRISIFRGPPGSGKTHLIRGLLNSVPEATFVIVGVDLISELSGPSIISSLLDFRNENKGRPIVFILEDADRIMATRGSDNMGSISAFLNLGDGILGSVLDLRFVATTNADTVDIDAALLRPGRLVSMVDVGPLPAWQAARILARLTGRESSGFQFNSKTVLAEIYSLASDQGWASTPKKHSIGFSSSLPSLATLIKGS